MTFLWRHKPIISSPPIEVLDHSQNQNKDIIEEKAVFKLENNKFLYIRYSGVLDNSESGVTDIEEFEDYNKAKEVFDDL